MLLYEDGRESELREKIMLRIGQVIEVKPEYKAEYIKLHESIPAEVAKLIRECNIRNYSIFSKGNMLFSYYEYVGCDYAADMEKMAASEDNQKWWALVKPLMQPLAARKENEFWAEMDPIFYQE